jgi:hypothetical protein
VENCHVTNVIISPAGGVHCNVYHSKSMVQKFGFFRGSIATNDELVLLTIEGKWLEVMHMIESKFLDLPHLKQGQLFISICIHGKFQFSPIFTFVGFQEDIQQFIPQAKISLKGKNLVVPLAIIPSNNV